MRCGAKIVDNECDPVMVVSIEEVSAQDIGSTEN